MSVVIDKKTTLMRAETTRETRIFEIIVKVITFGVFCLTVFSALPNFGARLSGLLPALVVLTVLLIFRGNKIASSAVLGASLLYTVLCVALGFTQFVNGALSFLNDVTSTANANMGWGLPYVSADSAFVGDFMFSSVLAVWLGVIFSFACRKRAITVALGVGIVLLCVCLGLFPPFYVALLWALAITCAFVCGKGFSVKSALCYILCAVLLFGIASSCFAYSGSQAVSNLRDGIVYSAESVFYGKDSLPEGDLTKRSVHSGDVRLEVAITQETQYLYLKGFVGGRLAGNQWKVTDRNAYVDNGRQGLLRYVGQIGLPETQFATYSRLNGSSDTFEVSVKNVNANAKYVYAPYTVSSYSAGTPNYDLNLRTNLFSSKTYTFDVFARNKNCEWITQAQWLLTDSNRTEEREEYLSYEGEYRLFATEVYTEVDGEILDKITPILDDIDAGSINTVTQSIRRYFLNNFTFSENADEIKSDFITEFFGGEIKRANAMYFATAATYMFRAYGLAARYVEGYYAHSTKSTDFSRIRLTDSNAHAWTEVYFEGIGWLPIETTPTKFSEKEMNSKPVPNTPNIPTDDIEDPTPPPPQEPDDPKPPVTPEKPLSPAEQNLLLALKILTPTLAIALAFILSILTIVLNRAIKMRKKRKIHKLSGAEYGRAVYSVVERDCKHFGGFSPQLLERYGVPRKDTERFVSLVEKNVYGGYELSANEKSFLIDFVKRESQAFAEGNKFRIFCCKYVWCLGM